MQLPSPSHGPPYWGAQQDAALPAIPPPALPAPFAVYAPPLGPGVPPPDVWGAINALTQATNTSINALTQAVNTLVTRESDRRDDGSVSSEPTPPAAAPKTKGPSKEVMLAYFKVPSLQTSAAEKDNTLISWRMKYEFPLKQERNRQEVKASLRVIKILINLEMEPGIRDALVASLSRCEEILLLETDGSAYATAWAKQVNLHTEDASELASCHRAALLASGRSFNESHRDAGPKGRSRQHPKKRRRHGTGGGDGQN
jgi:hypothetical protein